MTTVAINCTLAAGVREFNREPEPDERGVLIPPGEEALIELRTQIFKDMSTRRIAWKEAPI